MIRAVLGKIVDGIDLSENEAITAMTSIMEGTSSDPQIASFLVALRMKGATVDEIYAFAKVMRKMAIHISAPMNAIDTCGTGGDGSGTFNVSTTAAFVIAGAGVPVAKHGNRGVSSKCGSADLLEALGVPVNLTPIQVETCIKEVGIGFLFEPSFHKSMRHAVGPRRELGFRTIFNILGPLTNPANVKHQLVGVYDPSLTEPIAEVLDRFNVKHALVVHGDGLDEITTTGPTKITELSSGEISTYTITPEEFGLKKAELKDLKGGQPEDNAKILHDILSGKPSPYLDMVILNSAAGLFAANKVANISQGIETARDVIEGLKAKQSLETLTDFSKQLLKEG
ncbi:MAG: anthranilate phosphoribosyltransferase [Candidatus Thorarchaeota archaeon]|nr:MAG: anthranilate phosphoribosyltransferase [Candidatus Thorarchaeota archaeon]